jgi:hypothetical protein
MGVGDRPIPLQSPARERVIASIRRECLDHVAIFGEQHLRHLLLLYRDNGVRIHLLLGMDAPIPRVVQSSGAIFATPILGGLHHQYVRI